VKILIVDDDPGACAVLKAYLKRHVHGWIAEAVDGLEAIGMIRKEPPDLVFLDIGLPRVSGLEVLRTVRADPAHRTLPVVVLSGTGDEAIVRQAIALGIEDYLVKPLRSLVVESRLVRTLKSIEAWGRG
jgi:two-component system cell cycle response regulator